MMPNALLLGSPEEIAFIDANVPPACIHDPLEIAGRWFHGAHCTSPESPAGSLDSEATSGNSDLQNRHRSGAFTHAVPSSALVFNY